MMPCLHNFNVELKLTIHGVFNYLWKLSKNFSRLILSISNFRQYFSANLAQWKIVCVWCVCVCMCMCVCVCVCVCVRGGRGGWGLPNIPHCLYCDSLALITLKTEY